MSKWRDRLSDAAVEAMEGRLSASRWDLSVWERDDTDWNLFGPTMTARARVYDSLSCDGLGVDELDDEPVKR